LFLSPVSTSLDEAKFLFLIYMYFCQAIWNKLLIILPSQSEWIWAQQSSVLHRNPGGHTPPHKGGSGGAHFCRTRLPCSPPGRVRASMRAAPLNSPGRFASVATRTQRRRRELRVAASPGPLVCIHARVMLRPTCQGEPRPCQSTPVRSPGSDGGSHGGTMSIAVHLRPRSRRLAHARRAPGGRHGHLHHSL
jgi:hypothetical protein